MTALAAELLRILKSGEALMADSFPAILAAVGYGTARVEVGDVEVELAGLIALGHVDREWRRGRAYYRAAISSSGASRFSVC